MSPIFLGRSLKSASNTSQEVPNVSMFQDRSSVLDVLRETSLYLYAGPSDVITISSRCYALASTISRQQIF